MWADRIINSAIARQLIESGHATSAELQAISKAWNQWAADDDGWISILHSEVVCRIS